jgi:hypothetical protein
MRPQHSPLLQSGYLARTQIAPYMSVLQCVYTLFLLSSYGSTVDTRMDDQRVHTLVTDELFSPPSIVRWHGLCLVVGKEILLERLERHSRVCVLRACVRAVGVFGPVCVSCSDCYVCSAQSVAGQ